MNRRVNVKLLAFLVGAALLFSLGVHLLHGFQERRNATALLQQADRAAEQGQREQAILYLRTYLGFVPDDTDALTRYGLQLTDLASSPKARLQALEVLEQVLRRDPARGEIRRRLVDLALHPQVRRFADAREHLEILLRDGTADPAGLHRRLAQCCEGMADFAAAAQWYEKAIERDPPQVESYASLAELLRRRLDNPRRAEEVLDAMVKANPQAVAAYLARAKFRRELGQDEQAAADIAKATEIAPDEAGVLLAAARLAMVRREHDQARHLLERGLRLHPQQGEFYLALADLELQTQHPAQAVAILRRGVELMPAQTDLLWALSNLLVQQKQVPADEMARLAQRGVPAAQRDFLQAKILMNRGEWLQAARLLEKTQPGLRSWPELSKQADLHLGECHGHLANLDQQYAAYRRAVSIDPFWEPACLGLAAAQSARGETDEAIETYRRIMARVPAVRVPMARLLVARNLRLPPDRQRWPEVERLLDEAAKAVPDSGTVAIVRGEMLVAQGQFPAAEEVLRKARDARPEHAEPWIALAALAVRQERFDAALAALDAAGEKLGDRVELRLARAGYWAERGGNEAAAALARLRQDMQRFTADEQKQLLRGLASVHLMRGEEVDAETLWTRLAQQSPGDLHSRLILFDLALQGGNEEALHRLLGEMKGIEGAEGVYWRYGQAGWLIRLGKQGNPDALAEARALLDKLATIRPTWSRLAVAQAEIHELLHDPSAAIKQYQKALEMGERQSQAIRRLVELLYQQRRYGEAEEVMQKLPQTGAMDPGLQRLAAAVSLQRQDPERAMKLARQAVSADSKDYRDYLWLGQFLAATSEKAQAEQMLRRAVELGETVPDTWVALIHHLARTGQKDHAEAALADARSKLPRDQAAMALASCHEGLGQLDAARQLYREAIQARPEDAGLLRSVASFALRYGPPAEAEQRLRKLMAMTQRSADDSAWARRTLAVLLAGSGDYTRWREALTFVGLSEESDLPKSTADNVEDQRARAVVLAAQKSRRHRQRAIALLDDLRGRQPLSAEEQYLLAQLHESIGDWPAARQQMLQLLTGHGSNARFVAHYAHTLLRRGEAAEAEIWFKKLEKLPDAARSFTFVDLKARLQAEQVTRLKATPAEVVETLNRYLDQEDAQPSNPVARLLLVGNLLDELNQKNSHLKDRIEYFEGAEKVYRRLQDKQPERVLDRIAFLSRNRSTDKALELCEGAWETCPPVAVAATCLAVVRNGSGPAEQQRVEQWLTDGLKKHPQAAPALLVCLADLRDLQGRYADAVKCYRQAIAADPRNVVALNNLAYLLALHGNGPAEALELLNRAIALAGPAPELVDTRAVIYMKLGQPAKAIKDLESALADSPLPAACYHLAQAHQLAKNGTAARDALRRAKSLGLQADQLHALERPGFQQLHEELGTR